MRLWLIFSVVVGWVMIGLLACLLITPVIYSYTENGLVPVNDAGTALFSAVLVVLPLIYMLSIAITPLVMATLELFNDI